MNDFYAACCCLTQHESFEIIMPSPEDWINCWLLNNDKTQKISLRQSYKHEIPFWSDEFKLNINSSLSQIKISAIQTQIWKLPSSFDQNLCRIKNAKYKIKFYLYLTLIKIPNNYF